jgi:hypothetical protein
MPIKPKKDKKSVNHLPPGSLSLTLIANKDWKTNGSLIRKTLRTNQTLEKGAFFACNESYGGNTLDRKTQFTRIHELFSVCYF